MNQHCLTTTDMLVDLLAESYPLWLTPAEIVEELPAFRSLQSTRQSLMTMVRDGRVEMRTREHARFAPREYRAKGIE